MKGRFLRERALAELRANIEDNLPRYRAGEFDHLSLDPTLSFDTHIVIQEKELAALKPPQGKEFYDAENCAVILRALPKLTPYEAADERLWVMLSHTLLLEHARKRWPIPKKDSEAVNHIKTHFFASSQRQLERDNVGSRLWWMAHLCDRVEGMKLKETLIVLLFRSDVRANIIERPTTAQSIPVFTALMRQLALSYQGKRKLFERSVFRNLMIRLNGLGGYKLLDALDTKAVESFLKQIISADLKISQW
jgi:Family of unknown function (DUF6339)